MKSIAEQIGETPHLSPLLRHVDAILPSKDILALEQNEDFWQAQQRTNAELGDSGLYFTHLSIPAASDRLSHGYGFP